MDIELTSASFTFLQEGNCVDGGYEELEIRFESSLGLDHDGGGFFILKTEQWSVNDAKELQELFDRINGIIKTKKDGKSNNRI